MTRNPRNELLRKLPALDRWLASETGSALCAEFSQPEVARVMRERLARLRENLLAGERRDLPALESDAYAAGMRAQLNERRHGSLRRLINATGIVIHTNLGRAPLAPEALAAIDEVAGGYSNLELELATGKRGSRQNHAETLIAELTGAEAALVVNNCASAVVLMLNTFAKDHEVVISRGELVEIGGSFRMPDVIAQSGARMVEVGTTNKTRLGDYVHALTNETRILLASHPSNYRVVGFSATPDLRALSELAHEHELMCVQDLGSGCLVDLGLGEPTVRDSIGQGADLVAFSGDKLLGGPQAGIVVGRAELVDAVKHNPLARALRIDKLSLAALAATLRLYMPPNEPRERVPVLRMITESLEDVGKRAEALLARLPPHASAGATLDDDTSFAGGGSLPMHEIPTRIVRLNAEGVSAAELARRLRSRAVPVIARVARDSVCLDLRTVSEGELGELAVAVEGALAAKGSA